MTQRFHMKYFNDTLFIHQNFEKTNLHSATRRLTVWGRSVHHPPLGRHPPLYHTPLCKISIFSQLRLRVVTI